MVLSSQYGCQDGLNGCLRTVGECGLWYDQKIFYDLSAFVIIMVRMVTMMVIMMTDIVRIKKRNFQEQEKADHGFSTHS